MSPMVQTFGAAVGGGAVALLGQWLFAPAPPPPPPPPAPVVVEALPPEPAPAPPAPVLLGDLAPGTVLLVKTADACPEGWTRERLAITATTSARPDDAGRPVATGMMSVVGGDSASPVYFLCSNG